MVLSVIVSQLIPSHTFTYLASLYPLSHTSSAEFGSAVTLILPETVSLSVGFTPIPTLPFSANLRLSEYQVPAALPTLNQRPHP